MLFTYGYIAHIPLRLHVNWFLTVGVMIGALAVGYFPQYQPGWEKKAYWIAGGVTSFLFFVSILLHEVGHAVVAWREGVRVKSITLFILGGAVHIEGEPATAGAEFRIVAAGPLVNLFLGGIFGAAEFLLVSQPAARQIFSYLAGVNFFLALFNLIPTFPLDGGRMLRAALWKMQRDFTGATQWALQAGLGISFLILVAGLVLLSTSSWETGVWTGGMGCYLLALSLDAWRQERLSSQVQKGALMPGKITLERSNPMASSPLLLESVTRWRFPAARRRSPLFGRKSKA